MEETHGLTGYLPPSAPEEEAKRLRFSSEWLKSKIGNLKWEFTWLLPGVLVAALLMRFAMRALGVREDIPFPGFIYSATQPLVQPFYRLFPVSPRFDYHATEVASLVAAGTVAIVASLVYVLLLAVSKALEASQAR